MTSYWKKYDDIKQLCFQFFGQDKFQGIKPLDLTYSYLYLSEINNNNNNNITILFIFKNIYTIYRNHSSKN